MLKIFRWLALLIMVVLVVGCRGLEKPHLTRVDLLDVESGEVVMMTNQDQVDGLKSFLDEIKWQQNVKAEMARKEDKMLTLFYQFDKNMPERLYEYRVWISENNESVTVISNNEIHGYGELSGTKAKEFVEILAF